MFYHDDVCHVFIAIDKGLLSYLLCICLFVNDCDEDFLFYDDELMWLLGNGRTRYTVCIVLFIADYIHSIYKDTLVEIYRSTKWKDFRFYQETLFLTLQ